MNGTEIEPQHAEEHIITGEVTDSELEAAAGADVKSGCITYIACTSLALSCPG
jgi:hypothetical protein